MSSTDQFHLPLRVDDGQIANTMPGVWQQVYRIHDNVSLNLLISSGREPHPDPARIWSCILVGESGAMERSQIGTLTTDVQWAEESVMNVKESNITSLVRELRKNLSG